MSEQDQEAESTEEEVAPVALPGHRLKLTREDLHLSKDEVAHHLHLDVQIVEALESDNYESLPSPAYICGYLRSYARILKLPEDEIVNAYSKGHEINAALIPETVSMEPEKKMNPAVMKFAVIIILVLLIAAGLMWIAEKFHMFDVVTNTESTNIDVPIPEVNRTTVIERPAQVQEQIQQYHAENVTAEQRLDVGEDAKSISSESAVADNTQNQETTTSPFLIDEGGSAVNATAIVEPVQAGDLKLVFVDDSWIEVTDSVGKRHLYRLVDKGSEIYVDGIPPYTILLGNAEGVDVFYKNKPFNHKRYQRDQIAYFRLGTTE